MKISAQEEYGLRILVRIAGCRDDEGMSIPQLAVAEGLSSHYIAKLTRLLRMEGFINSTPGYKGGYVLALPAKDIRINKVITALGGSMLDSKFNGLEAGVLKLCTHSVDCSTRSLWQMIQVTIDGLLDKITLHDLVNAEQDSSRVLIRVLAEHNRSITQ